ncbi:MAG TPA: hypothetical protein VGJ41_03705 [Nocardioides sp.]
MPTIRTDDAPRRLRAVWLGPKGFRWPVDWTYVQWSIFAVLVVICPVLIFVLLVWVDPAIAAGAAFGGPYLAYRMVKRIPEWVDYDRPVRFWLRTFRAEFSGSTRVSRLGERRELVAATEPTEMSRGAQYVLYPAKRWRR